nr:uncharacterized protein LOC104117166 [Nicotiana tomentosiformis]
MSVLQTFSLSAQHRLIQPISVDYDFKSENLQCKRKNMIFLTRRNHGLLNHHKGNNKVSKGKNGSFFCTRSCYSANQSTSNNQGGVDQEMEDEGSDDLDLTLDEF